MTPRRLRIVTKDEWDRLETERLLNHHIPYALIEKLDGLDNVCYRDLLRGFQERYCKAAFEELEEEYEMIKDEICRLMNQTFSNPFTEVVETNMRATLAAADFEGTVREQFIHPFQNFLLGMVIMDSFYESFKRWFSYRLCQSEETCVEASWLLACTFHDRLKPLSQFKGLIEFEEAPIKIVIPDEDMYIQRMTSLYEHLSAGRCLHTWSSDEVVGDLSAILKEYSEAENHGVRGSFSLFKHLRQAFGDGAFNPSYVQAALTIALHDHELRTPMLNNHMFPISIRKLPLTCLLLYCDAVQEWGRNRTHLAEPRLVNLAVTGGTVNCEVAFDRSDSAKAKLNEIDDVMNCIKSSTDIDFMFSPRVHASL